MSAGGNRLDNRRFIEVCGGGDNGRAYQKAALMIAHKLRGRAGGLAREVCHRGPWRSFAVRGHACSCDTPARAGLPAGKGIGTRGGMTLSTGWRDEFAQSRDYARCDAITLPKDSLGARLVGGAALACFATAYILWAQLGGDGRPDATPQDKPAAAAHAYTAMSDALTKYARRLATARSYDPLMDARHLLGATEASFAARFVATAVPQDDGGDAQETTSAISQAAAIDPQAPAAAASQPAAKVAAAPQPSRATHIAQAIRNVSSHAAAVANSVAETAETEKTSLFEKLFGKPKPVALAYAAPDDAGLVRNIADRYDQWTAVYDISAHKVYLPDGSVLEAHSGRGSALDDPRHTNERMQGSTPVNIYDLKPRESLFHGVQAIRLIPVDESQVFGRSGFLAHTYMLGPNGDSFGCVSFRNYDAFLQAFKEQKLKHLAVVASLS
jgi:hypothetical protein